jgi:hypothetical protein
MRLAGGSFFTPKPTPEVSLRPCLVIGLAGAALKEFAPTPFPVRSSAIPTDEPSQDFVPDRFRAPPIKES